MARRREELARIIIGGETVIHGNNVIVKPQDLPSEVILAGSDIVRKQHAIGEARARAAAAAKEAEELERESQLSDDELSAKAEAAKEAKPKQETETPEAHDAKAPTVNVGVRKAQGSTGVKAVKSDGGSGHKTEAPG